MGDTVLETRQELLTVRPWPGLPFIKHTINYSCMLSTRMCRGLLGEEKGGSLFPRLLLLTFQSGRISHLFKSQITTLQD